MNAISRVGFIGLGAMGAPMAGHLQAKGLLAAVGNRTQTKAEALAAALGVRAACGAHAERGRQRLGLGLGPVADRGQ